MSTCMITEFSRFRMTGFRLPQRGGNLNGNHTNIVGNGNQVNSPTTIVNNQGLHRPPRPHNHPHGFNGIGNIGNLLGGFGIGLPMFGSGAVAGNGCASAWSQDGFASANPFGASVFSGLGGKSKSINLGGLGSYASGDGGRALNILGIFSQSRSHGNTAYDFSGLTNLLTGGLF